MTDLPADFAPQIDPPDVPIGPDAPVDPPDAARLMTPAELLASTIASIAPLVTQYRINQSTKKLAEANLDGLKGELKPLLNRLAELTQDSWSDERGFAKIVLPKSALYHFMSDDNADALYGLALNWAASDVPALKQAGESTLHVIETKTRNPYVLVK
jgi:hypothetical protein